MKSKLESAYAKALTGTFKVINPIKKTIKKTECEVHLYICLLYTSDAADE